MKINLERLALERNPPFNPDHSISLRYNTFLSGMFQIEPHKEGFTLDKRGLSPEMSIELGDYLTMREINPYLVIASPEQAKAPLTRQLFSFDNALLDQVYAQAGKIIANVTPNEVLWGEMENGVDILGSHNDLLRVDSVSVRLDTPLESLKKIKHLQEMHGRLRNYLPDDSRVSEMLELHKRLKLLRYDDVRGLEANGVFPIKISVSSFHTALFGGVYVIRDSAMRGKGRTKGDTLMIHQGDAEKAPNGVHSFSINDRNSIIAFLEDNDFVDYDYSDASVQNAMRAIEDRMLLDKGFDLVPDRETVESREKYEFNRKRGIYKFADSLPSEWRRLNDLLTTVKRGNVKKSEIAWLQPETRILMMVPQKQEDMVGRLLMDLDATKVRYDLMGAFGDENYVFNALEQSGSGLDRKYACAKMYQSMEGHRK